MPTQTAPAPTASGPTVMPSRSHPQLQAAGHPVALGVHPQQDALRQQHPHGILTDRDRLHLAGQRHPSGHRQPGGDRGGIGSDRALGRLGPSGVTFWEVGLQAPHHNQGDQRHHHDSGHQPAVASCCVHADSRSPPATRSADCPPSASITPYPSGPAWGHCGGRAAQPIHSPGPCRPQGRPRPPLATALDAPMLSPGYCGLDARPRPARPAASAALKRG